MKNDKIVLIANFNINGYETIKKCFHQHELELFNAHIYKFINQTLNLENGRLLSEDGSNYKLLWKDLNLIQAQKFSHIVLENFHLNKSKVNKPEYPEIDLFLGISSLPEESILEDKINLNFLMKNVSILAQNCIFYGINNLISQELFSKDLIFREIDRRILYGENEPITIYTAILE